MRYADDDTQFTSAAFEATAQAGRAGTKKGIIHMGEASKEATAVAQVKKLPVGTSGSLPP